MPENIQKWSLVNVYITSVIWGKITLYMMVTQSSTGLVHLVIYLICSD